MIVDFQPGPVEASMRARAVEARRRLFSSPVVRTRMAPIPEPVIGLPVIEPEPVAEVAMYPRRPTVRSVMRDACEAHEVTMEELRSNSRVKRIVRARQQCFYHMRRYVSWRGGQMSLITIANFFGVDHTTVIHGINQHTKRLAGDAE